MLFTLLSLIERLASSKAAQAARREKLLSLLASLQDALERMTQGSECSGGAPAGFSNAASDFLSCHKLLAPSHSEPMERLSNLLESATTNNRSGTLPTEQVHQLLTEVKALAAALK
jgi:hypothetical protein